MSGSLSLKQKLLTLIPHIKIAHGHVKRHYYTVMPNKKHHRVLVWVIFLTTSTLIAGQLLYPPDRMLPFARFGSQGVGYKTYNEMAELLAKQFDKTKVQLVTKNGHMIERPLKLAGVEPNSGGMITKLSDYPLWLRFVPFSVLLPKEISTFDVAFSGPVLKKFALAERKSLSEDALNARLTIEKGKLIASSEKMGERVTENAIISSLIANSFKIGGTTKVIVPSKTLKPTRTSADFVQVKAQAEDALAESITIKAGDNSFTPNTTEIATWLVIGSNEKGGATLVLDRAKVSSYLATITQRVGTPAGTTNVSLINGNETGRSVGQNGRAIDQETLITAIGDRLLHGSGSQVMTASFVDVAPTVVYNNQYSATEEGLRKYVSDVSSQRNMRISIQQIDGAKWSASARANESTPSASTYKLFVSLMLFDKMEKGEIHWNDPMLDTTVDVCFDRMTIASTNPCAEQWLANWGRSNVNDFVYYHGFSGGTTFTNPTATHTTAADLTKYMIGLNDGTLVKGAYRDRLLHSLSVHPYRYGVPTGSKGQVRDKVGFLWDYVHDAAIVHHPRGTYVMTVMTKGQSYGAIATVTREVEKIMYP